MNTSIESGAGGELKRREALAAMGVGVFGLAGGALAAQPAGQGGGQAGVQVGGQAANAPQGAAALQMAKMGYNAEKGEYELPPLAYPAEALEPHIDAMTMQIHHGRHHKSYVDGANKALKALADIRAGNGDASLVKHWSRELAFHGSGHVNHTLFWLMMAPPSAGGGGKPQGSLAEAITRDFGSFDGFAMQFKAAATQVEGSGWAWLMWEPMARRLMITQMEKQQDVYLTNARPVLGIDVWEHAYYLKYQNKRADYVAAFMNVVNWGFCQALFDKASA